MKLLAFAASSSSTSINKQLVTFAVSLLEPAEIEILDLNNYQLPLFSVDKENELGKPALALEFFAKIGACDALMISFAEHNGTYTAAYKNLFDWCSRIDSKVFQNKPVVMLSCSPGARGGASVLATATKSAPFFAGELKAHYSIPLFYENFNLEKDCFNNQEIHNELLETVNSLKYLL